MPVVLNTFTLVIRLAFCFMLLLLLVAERSDSWRDIKVMLPWALAISSRDLRAHLRHTVLANKVMVAASALLALLIATGCQIHACTASEANIAFIPVLWIPVAALIRSMRTDAQSTIFVTTGIAVFAVAIFILWQFFVQGKDRPYGFSFNVMAGPMILGMLCLMRATGWRHVSQALRRWFYCVAAIGILASICTDAKTGLLTFFVGTLIYMAANREQAIKTLLITLPIMLIWSFALSSKLQTIQVDIERYDKKEYRTSFGERTDAIIWGVAHIVDNPFLGKGATQLEDQYNQRWREWRRPKDAVTPMLHLHNDYLQIALSKGIPALLCFVALWVGLAVNCVRSMLQNPEVGSSVSWILALIGIYMTAFATDSFTHWNSTWGAAMACVGMAFALIEPPPRALTNFVDTEGVVFTFESSP